MSIEVEINSQFYIHLSGNRILMVIC